MYHTQSLDTARWVSGREDRGKSFKRVLICGRRGRPYVSLGQRHPSFLHRRRRRHSELGARVYCSRSALLTLCSLSLANESSAQSHQIVPVCCPLRGSHRTRWQGHTLNETKLSRRRSNTAMRWDHPPSPPLTKTFYCSSAYYSVDISPDRLSSLALPV